MADSFFFFSSSSQHPKAPPFKLFFRDTVPCDEFTWGDEEQHGGYIFSKEILSHQGAPHVRKPGELDLVRPFIPV
jgi:hypothetical protein